MERGNRPPAAGVFMDDTGAWLSVQVLRIAVKDGLGVLETQLERAPDGLVPCPERGRSWPPAHRSFAPVTAELLRNSLKLAVAALLTAALAAHTERIEFLWYPLLAVVIVVDDNDDLTLQAALGRILGTMAGCLITFLVHRVASGWPGVLLSLLLMIPVLRLLGWQSALGTAGLMSLMFLMVPSHAALDWGYALNRALDTAVGCAVALAVGLIFWPRSGMQQLGLAEEGLLALLRDQLAAYRRWQAGEGPRPEPLPPAPLASGLARMDSLLHGAIAGPHGRRLRAAGWNQRVALWHRLRLHWLQWERLLAASDLPPPPPGAASPLAEAIERMAARLAGDATPDPPEASLPAWTRLAAESRRPLLLVLALAQEQRPLLDTCRQLAAAGGLRP